MDMDNQSSYITNYLSQQNSTTQARSISTSRTDPLVVELLNQQQVLQEDIPAVISKLPELQTKHKNDHFLANLQIYNDKDDKSFLHWINQVENITMPSQCPEIQLSLAKKKALFINALRIFHSHQHMIYCEKEIVSGI